MSYHFGLKPWDLPALTPGELDAYLEALDDIAREAKANG